MILGLGNDVVNIERIEKSLTRFGEKFLQKILSAAELSTAKRLSNANQIAAFCAKRFAAKEALVKALGTGFQHGITFRDIEVVNDHNGKPELKLYNAAEKRLQALTPPGAQAQIHISLSDDYPIAYAVVIISGSFS